MTSSGKLVAQVRVNKNGIPVTKHVLPDASSAPVSPSNGFPAPALTVAVNVLPALRGKVLKEAKEIVNRSSGDTRYEDWITGCFLGNDIRSMRIMDSFTNSGRYDYPGNDIAIDIVESRQRLGLGEDEDVDTYVDKCQMMIDVCTFERGPVYFENFHRNSRSVASDKLIRFMDENWRQADEISVFMEERHLEESSADDIIRIWTDVNAAEVKALRDGVL